MRRASPIFAAPGLYAVTGRIWGNISPLCGRPTADSGSNHPHARDDDDDGGGGGGGGDDDDDDDRPTDRPTPQSRLQGFAGGPKGLARHLPETPIYFFKILPPVPRRSRWPLCWQSSHYTVTDAELATHVGQRSDDRTIGQIGRSDEAHRTHGQSRLDVANGIQPTRPIRPVWPTSSLNWRTHLIEGNRRR